jgi:transposase
MTVLEECTTKEQDSVVRLLWAKGLNAKDIHKEIFSVFGGKCLSLKTIHIWVEKFSQRRSKIADDTRPVAEVTETTVKRLLCCGFRRTGKAIGQVYQCWWRICREINVYFFNFECHIFYILYIFLTYLRTLPLTYICTYL